MTRFFPLLFALTWLITTLSTPATATASRTPMVAQRGPAPPDVQIDQTIRTKLAKSKIGKDGFRFSSSAKAKAAANLKKAYVQQ